MRDGPTESKSNAHRQHQAPAQFGAFLLITVKGTSPQPSTEENRSEDRVMILRFIIVIRNIAYSALT